MGEVVQFVPRAPGWKVAEGPSNPQAISDEITAAMFASGLDMPVEDLLLYASGLGFVAPDWDGA